MQDPVPDLPEVLHTDDGSTLRVPGVPVEVRGYVTTQELPAVHSVSRSIFVDNADTSAQELVGIDARRKSLTIWVETQGAYINEDRQGVTGAVPYGAHLPAGGPPVTVHHQNAVWIRGDNATATLVSVVLEQWAD